MFCQGEYNSDISNAHKPWPKYETEEDRMSPDVAFQLLTETEGVAMWMFEDGSNGIGDNGVAPTQETDRHLSKTSELLLTALQQREEGNVPDEVAITLIVEEHKVNPPPGDKGATGNFLDWLPLRLLCHLDGILVRTHQDADAYEYFLPKIGMHLVMSNFSIICYSGFAFALQENDCIGCRPGHQTWRMESPK